MYSNSVYKDSLPEKEIRKASIRLRRQRFFLGLAILFIVLGVGNILFGNLKTHQYVNALSKSLADNTIPKLEANSQSIPILNRSINLSKEIQHINRIKSRVNFYEFVILGGKVFLAIAGVLLLIVFVGGSRAGGEEASV